MTEQDVNAQHLASMGLDPAKLGEPIPEKIRPNSTCRWHFESGGKCHEIGKHTWPDPELNWLCPTHYRAKLREKAEWDAMDAAAKKDDPVNHPQHYGGRDDHYEAIKVIEAWGLGFCLGNTVKYVSRAGKKDPSKTIEDLKKARWYLDREITRLETGHDEPREGAAGG